MKRIPIAASKPYEAIITEGFNDLFAEVNRVFGGEKIAVITDDNTHRLFYGDVKAALKGYEVVNVNIAAGEKSKSVGTYAEILSALASAKLKRGDCVLTLGGGVVGDVGGFAASTYMRGVTYIQCPTTLLADVDSSVGGKTAIDFPEGKNLAGTFYQPSLVYINTECLKTLPPREIDCGMGEIVKYAFLDKTVSLADVKELNYQTLIEKSIKIKADIVCKDEFDKGVRALLNLGHTIGHAIEVASGFTLSHGACVAKGIDAIIDISTDFYGLSEEKTNEMKALLRAYPFDLDIDCDKEKIAEKIALDKKAEKGGVKFILLKGVGSPIAETLPVEEAIRCWRR